MPLNLKWESEMETKITSLPTEAMQQTQQEARVFLRQGSKLVAGHEGVFVEDKVILAKAADELAKANSELETLRQQVADITKHRDELLKHIGERTLTPTGLEELALRDLEIVKLREVLQASYDFYGDGYKVDAQVRKVLSTPFTPSDLNAYVEAEIAKRLGEPVAWVWYVDGYDMYTNDFEYMKSIQKYKPTTPLYSVKEIV